MKTKLRGNLSNAEYIEHDDSKFLSFWSYSFSWDEKVRKFARHEAPQQYFLRVSKETCQELIEYLDSNRFFGVRKKKVDSSVVWFRNNYDQKIFLDKDECLQSYQKEYMDSYAARVKHLTMLQDELAVLDEKFWKRFEAISGSKN